MLKRKAMADLGLKSLRSNTFKRKLKTMMYHYRLAKHSVVLGAAFLMLSGYGNLNDRPVFNPKTCLQEAPQTVPGVRIISGPRTEKNIVAGMQSAYCNGQMLFMLLNEKEGKITPPGEVLFQVTVEYTGEVKSAEVVQSDIDATDFLRKLKDMIMATDFSPWARHDDDAQFIYPMTFTSWWEK